MRVEQQRWTSSAGWVVNNSSLTTDDRPALVMVFASPEAIHQADALDALRNHYPDAVIVGGSTAGNVLSVSSSDTDMVATAVAFEHSSVRLVTVDVDESTNLKAVVGEAVQPLVDDQLRHVLVLSDGLHVNGSELAQGLNEKLSVQVSGGLMGDNGAFEQTWVIANGPPRSNQIALLGLYGDKLEITHGCFAGWEEFGINRVVTRAQGNVVYEIDGQPALTLYKKYLGNFADELPASGLRFPLSIRGENGEMLIRTLLGIDEETQSLTFAGDVPEGTTTLLMRGSTDSLVDGANAAAEQAASSGDKVSGDSLAVVISCVGRRMVMDQMADDELDAIQEVLGENTRLTGFYSYGELAGQPDQPLRCSLHNQTMTLMTLGER